MRYFNYWLKGHANGEMHGSPVCVQVRTGNGAYYDLHESEWPIARTRYTKLYLDASQSGWQNDERRQDLLRITHTPPTVGTSKSYDAHLTLGQPVPFPKGHVGGTPRWSTGISFVSDPMPEDMVLVGYMKVGLWVSSTSSDMDVHEVLYDAVGMPIDPEHIHPVGYGLLKVSHRKLDTDRSTEYGPVHTHAAADYAPLAKDDVVAIELGLNPSTAVIRRGYRLKVDIQPNAPAGIPSRAYDERYHVGATNTIHTGPQHPCYIQLPIVPRPAG